MSFCSCLKDERQNVQISRSGLSSFNSSLCVWAPLSLCSVSKLPKEDQCMEKWRKLIQSENSSTHTITQYTKNNGKYTIQHWIHRSGYLVRRPLNGRSKSSSTWSYAGVINLWSWLCPSCYFCCSFSLNLRIPTIPRMPLCLGWEPEWNLFSISIGIFVVQVSTDWKQPEFSSQNAVWLWCVKHMWELLCDV